MKIEGMKKMSKFLLLWLVGVLLSVQAFAQGITVKGVVKDNTGEPVIGANVLVKTLPMVLLPTLMVILR